MLKLLNCKGSSSTDSMYPTIGQPNPSSRRNNFCKLVQWWQNKEEKFKNCLFGRSAEPAFIGPPNAHEVSSGTTQASLGLDNSAAANDGAPDPQPQATATEDPATITGIPPSSTPMGEPLFRPTNPQFETSDSGIRTSSSSGSSPNNDSALGPSSSRRRSSQAMGEFRVMNPDMLPPVEDSGVDNPPTGPSNAPIGPSNCGGRIDIGNSSAGPSNTQQTRSAVATVVNYTVHQEVESLRQQVEALRQQNVSTTAPGASTISPATIQQIVMNCLDTIAQRQTNSPNGQENLNAAAAAPPGAGSLPIQQKQQQQQQPLLLAHEFEPAAGYNSDSFCTPAQANENIRLVPPPIANEAAANPEQQQAQNVNSEEQAQQEDIINRRPSFSELRARHDSEHAQDHSRVLVNVRRLAQQQPQQQRDQQQRRNYANTAARQRQSQQRQQGRRRACTQPQYQQQPQNGEDSDMSDDFEDFEDEEPPVRPYDAGFHQHQYQQQYDEREARYPPPMPRNYPQHQQPAAACYNNVQSIIRYQQGPPPRSQQITDITSTTTILWPGRPPCSDSATLSANHVSATRIYTMASNLISLLNGTRYYHFNIFANPAEHLKWKGKKVLGDGANGGVLLARHKKHRQNYKNNNNGEARRPLYAVKILCLDSRADAKVFFFTKQRILTEIKLSRKNCPNLVQAHQVYYYEDKVALVLELMNKSVGDLMEILPNGLPKEAVAYIAYEASKGVEYLHDKAKYFHGDIKMDNILIGFNGQVKLCDFGLSFATAKDVAGSSYGTITYMAPEVADPSKTYNKESDLWSFGMTIQKMLNLDPFEKEFHSKTSEAQMAEIASITNKNAIVDYKDFLDRHHLSLYFLVYGLLKVVPRNRFTARETKQYIHNHYVDEPSSFHCFTANQMCNLMVELGFTYRKLVK